MNPVVKDVSVMTVGAVADELSTAYALKNCPTCRELGPPAPIRYVGKAVVIGGSALAARELRKSGHKNWAKAVRYIPFVIWMSAAGINLHRGNLY